MITIRPERAGDQPGIQDVGAAATAILRRIYRPNQRALAHKARLNAHLHRLVATIDGRIVGTVQYYAENQSVKIVGLGSWLVSNGSWGRNPDFVRRFAQDMVAHGLVRAIISVDALHQEFVPFNSYTVGAEGKVSICTGFACPGDPHSMEFKDIVCKEHILENELIAAFHATGVRGLFDLVATCGYSSLEHYCSGCHLCSRVRDFLCSYFPDILTPAHTYGNESGWRWMA